MMSKTTSITISIWKESTKLEWIRPFRESRHTKERKYWEKLEKNKYMEKQTYTFSHVYFQKTSNRNKHSQFYFLIFIKYSNENYYVLKCQTIKVLKYFLQFFHRRSVLLIFILLWHQSSQLIYKLFWLGGNAKYWISFYLTLFPLESGVETHFKESGTKIDDGKYWAHATLKYFG